MEKSEELPSPTSRKTRSRRIHRQLHSMINQIRSATSSDVLPVPVFLSTEIGSKIDITNDQHNIEPDNSIIAEAPASNFQTLNDIEIIGTARTNDNRNDKLEQLGMWAIQNNITHVALSGLLKLIQEWMPNAKFPKDSRTLLHTQRNVEISKIAGGLFHHFGISVQINRFLASLTLPLDIRPVINLTFGIDGLPISKSSNLQFWPILCEIEILEFVEIFTASLFYGSKKPQSLEEFLNPFVEEISMIMSNGFSFNGTAYEIRLKYIVADAPGRSFIKCVKPHNAYFGCERCYRRGTWKKRVIYPVKEKQELYSDQSFRDRDFELHHYPQVVSPLERLEFGMISQIPLDYMHLICLGTMKKLLQVWCKGPRSHKLSPRDIKTISN